MRGLLAIEAYERGYNKLYPFTRTMNVGDLKIANNRNNTYIKIIKKTNDEYVLQNQYCRFVVRMRSDRGVVEPIGFVDSRLSMTARPGYGVNQMTEDTIMRNLAGWIYNIH
jgi:hypothetical protein